MAGGDGDHSPCAEELTLLASWREVVTSSRPLTESAGCDGQGGGKAGNRAALLALSVAAASTSAAATREQSMPRTKVSSREAAAATHPKWDRKNGTPKSEEAEKVVVG